MIAARVQALIAVAGETITDKRVTHGSDSTATLQSTPSVQSWLSLYIGEISGR